MTSKDYFRGKRIALIGLGHQAEMMTDAKFLIKAGALLSIYDLKSEARLKNYLIFLRSIGLANYVCNSVPPEDLLDMDLIILSHEYSREASFLKLAKNKGVQIEYPETLLFKLAPPVTVVGIMGACGKATVVSMLSPMLESVCKEEAGPSCFVADPESTGGILTHLKRMKNGDIFILRILPSMMRELRDIRISPQVSIFTTLPPKQAFDESPFEILVHQTYNNFIIANDQVIDTTRRYDFAPKAKMLRTKATLLPAEWQFAGRLHDRDNASLVIQAARLFKLEDEDIQRILESWKPLKGRLELVKKVKGIEYFNDTGSVMPDATIAGVSSISESRNLILIMGGADGSADYGELYAALPQYAHTVILLPGSGTMKERKFLRTLEHINILSVPSVEEAVRIAHEYVRKGDRVLFSPGFAAGGFDASREERGERFVRAVRSL